MKKLLTLFILLLIDKLFACVCMPKSIMDLTAKADFIATAKILSVNKDSENEDIHNIQIEILELFKGKKVNSLKLYSRLSSSCAFYTPENTTWLIFAYQEKDGKLAFGYCSGTKTMSAKFDSELYSRKFSKAELDKLNTIYLNKVKLEIEVLKYLRDSEIRSINEFDLKTYFMNDCLKNIKGFAEKTERFSLFELTINEDLSIQKVVALKEFENEKLALNLMECVKSKIFISAGKTKAIPNKSKIIIGLYYYPAKGKKSSFISKHSL
ncbi:hypothetical protein [uncultured Maribacter sp.]|uniref:hypothetical protein n=1 Tax=uncultured Maribacter sp. TaxID=431308 RepID=UPI002635AD90|nr:hypothetical protein [uncultured Maribacter sp.]